MSFFFIRDTSLCVCKGHFHPWLPVNCPIKVLSSSVVLAKWGQVCNKNLNNNNCVGNTEPPNGCTTIQLSVVLDTLIGGSVNEDYGYKT